MIKEKTEIRKYINSIKKKYDLLSLQKLSDKILLKLEISDDFCAAKTILMYYSLKDEVQTHDFIDKWKNKKTILLPVVRADKLELHIYAGKENLVNGAFHISEPKGTTFTDYKKIDLAIIPGIAFDNSGNRLGRGKGYYDRFLKNIKAKKIGLCFPFQIVEKLPTENFDIRMDNIITI